MTFTATILLAIAFVGCITFIIIYAKTAPWRSTWGWHMMIFVGSLGMILGLSLSYRIWGEYWGRQVLILVAFSVLTILIWQRVFMVIRAQRPPIKKDHPK